jgi:hypothetical protein
MSGASARGVAWVGGEPTQQLTVARLLMDVGKSLHAFDHGPHIPSEGRKQYLSRTVCETMRRAEKAFSDGDYDRAEHQAKVVAYLVKREAPIFAADPERWIAKWYELGWNYRRSIDEGNSFRPARGTPGEIVDEVELMRKP